MTLPGGILFAMRFADIAGHDHVKEVLRRAVDRDRVPHAYLFHGPDGVGKATMALALLSYLDCPNRRDGDSCGECATCRAIQDRTFVDLHVAAVDRHQIKIDEMRSLMGRLYFEAMVGPWKCLLVDDAHLLNLPAANAALKTLEEPPSRSLFILVTPTPDVLPQTVVSRCFQVPFGPLPADEVVRFLLRRRPDRPEDEARDAAVLSRGSPGRALALLEHPVLRERRAFLDAFLALPDQGAGERLAFSEGIAADRNDVPTYMALLGSLLSDLLLVAADLPPQALANADLAPRMRAFLDRVGPDRLMAVVEAYRRWDEDRVYQPFARAALDRMVLSL